MHGDPALRLRDLGVDPAGLDRRFKATGHVNAYFPLFIPESLLMREAEHVEGFAPQVAWVTYGGTEVLEERLAIRPTSETIIGTMYRQVDPVVAGSADPDQPVGQRRAVGKGDPAVPSHDRVPLAGRAHAHETAEEAQEETLRMLAVYKEFAENELAMPVMDGEKTESEKFAGADRTYSIEALMRDGRAPPGGHLSQPGTELRQGIRHHVSRHVTSRCSSCTARHGACQRA